MHKGRLLIMAAAILAVISFLLPYFEADATGSISAIAAGGTLPIAAMVGAGIIAATGDRREGLSGLAAIAAAAATTLALVVTGAITIDAVLAGREAGSLGFEASIRAGLWMLTVGAGAAAIGVLAAMSRRLS